MTEHERITLTARIDAINTSQARARTSLWLIVFAVGITLLALHNAYLAWDSEFAFQPQLAITGDTAADSTHGRNQARAALIKAWVDSQVISIPLIGIKVNTSDAPLLGSAFLFVLAYYYCLCVRRENRDIVHLLTDARGLDPAARRHLLFALRAGMVFNVTAADQPVTYPSPTPTAAPRPGGSRCGT